ncbi:MAG: DUF58 domain-containing protein [Nocardioides sp.]
MLTGLLRRAGVVLGVVKPLGWTVLVVGVLGLVGARLTGWAELAVLGGSALLLLAVAFPLLAGRTKVAVELRLEPDRVVAGQSVAASVRVTNTSSSRLFPLLLDLPVGESVHRYGIPALASRATHVEDFTIRTDRRGVIRVGPATTRRGDPLGLFSRDLDWTDVVEVLVRPPLVPLESLGSGLLRDLEGVSIDAVSQSDLAFHALREYVPGDDLRHVHWRSSAKATGAAGGHQLLVREYLDTRRSHLTLVVDDRADSWARPEDFELAMSAAASLAVLAVLDEFELSFVCGDQATSGHDGNRALDAVCRAGFGSDGLLAQTQQAMLVAPDSSLVVLMTARARRSRCCSGPRPCSHPRSAGWP